MNLHLNIRRHPTSVYIVSQMIYLDIENYLKHEHGSPVEWVDGGNITEQTFRNGVSIKAERSTPKSNPFFHKVILPIDLNSEERSKLTKMIRRR